MKFQLCEDVHNLNAHCGEHRSKPTAPVLLTNIPNTVRPSIEYYNVINDMDLAVPKSFGALRSGPNREELEMFRCQEKKTASCYLTVNS
jgi:hypothetical protein